MKVLRIFNNNVVATRTDENKDIICQGSGIGFKKKVGDEIDESKIERKYYILDEHREKFNKLFESTPIEYFQISEMILARAKKDLGKMSNTIILALTDHIYFAVQRQRQGISLPNLMQSEIKTIYPEEFAVAKWALGRIKEILGIDLPIDEAGYIAIHLANASLQTSSEKVTKLLVFTRDLLDIIRTSLNIELDLDEFNTSRLMTHIKFLGQRIIHDKNIELIEVEGMYDLLINKDIRIKETIDKIKDYILKTCNYELSQQEQVYLMVHILKILN